MSVIFSRAEEVTGYITLALCTTIENHQTIVLIYLGFSESYYYFFKDNVQENFGQYEPINFRLSVEFQFSVRSQRFDHWKIKKYDTNVCI